MVEDKEILFELRTHNGASQLPFTDTNVHYHQVISMLLVYGLDVRFSLKSTIFPFKFQCFISNIILNK